MSELTVISFLIAAAALAVALLAARHMRRLNKHKTAELYVRNMELQQEREDRQRIETELRLTTQSYRAMFANTRDMVLVYGITAEGLPGELVEVNEVAGEKLGYAREKLLTMGLMEIESIESPSAVLMHSRLHDVDNTVGDLSTLADGSILERERAFPIRRRMKQIVDEKHLVYESNFITANGTRVPVEVSAHYFDLDGQPMVMSTAHDIAHRRESERALRETERRFNDFFTHSPLGVAIYDAHRQLLDVNQSFLKMFQIPDLTAFAKFNVFDNPFLSEDDRAKIGRGESVRCEMDVDFDEARGKQVFLSSRRGTANFDILITNLGFDSDFNPKGHLVQVVDITQRRRTEAALRESELQLRQAQKMEAIGTLAGGIAHDFNNILTPILGYAEITLDTVPEGDDVRMYMEEILKASGRAKDLVSQILTFSRRSEGEVRRHPAHIIPIVKEVLALLRGSIEKNIEIQRIIKTDRDVVLCDQTQIHQVIMNLCTNARHAMKKEGGTLEVLITGFVKDARARGEFAALEPGRYIRISVKDTGTGMDRATVERIFEPFYTTKKSGEGTGMGLSVVHGIVTGMGGDILVETAPGEGSSFHVVMPVIEQAAGVSDDERDLVPRGDECVLFVDDEPDIARMASHMLASLGYDPVVCTRADEALELVRRDPGQYDVVISDQVMPEMPGTQLAHELRSLRPDLPVVLCSGFSEAISREQAELIGIQGFLAKPILRADLARAIRSALGSNGATVARRGARTAVPEAVSEST